MNWFDDVKKYYAFRSLIKRFVVPIAVLYAVDQGLSVEQIAFIGVAAGIVGFVLEIPSGAFADSLGHRRTLVLSMIGQAISMALYLGGSFGWILAASVAYWGSGTLMTGTMQALFFERLRELGREDEHQKLHGRARSISQAVGIISMLLAGIAYAWQWWLPFAIGIAQFLLAALIISRFVQAKRQTKVERFEPMLVFSHLKSGFVEVRKSSKLFWLTFFNAIILGTMWGSGEFHQILLEDVGLAVGLFGLVYALKRMVGVIIPPFVHHMSKKVSIPMYCITSGIIMALILILTLLANAPGTMAILLGLSAAPGIALTVAGNDFKNKLINGSSRATVLSMSNLIQQIVTLVFVGVTGVIVAHASLPVIYLAWGIGLLILIAVMTPAFGRAYHRG